MSLVVRGPGFRIARSYEVAFSPMGDRLACIGVHVDLWDVETRLRHRACASAEASQPYRLLARRVAACSQEHVGRYRGTRRLYAARSRPTPRPFRGVKARPFASRPTALSSSTGSWDGHLLVRDTMSGDVLYSEHDGTTMIVGIAATVDRSRWVVQSSTRSPHDAPNVVSIRQWPLSRDRVDVDLETGRNVVALHPSAMRLAIVTYRLRIWDVSDADRTTGSIVAQSPRFPISGTGNHVSWSPQGDRVALAGARAVRIFTPNAREVASIELEYASSVAYSPSGELPSHAALGAKDSSSRRQSSGDPLLRLSALPT